MSKRLAVLAATTALAAFAFPAAAQDGWEGESDAGVSWDEVETYSEEVVQGEASAYEPSTADAVESDAGVEWVEDEAPRARHHRAHRAPLARQTARLAYGDAERAEWLSQCRALRERDVEPASYYEEEEEDGGLIGGLLGAVFGGFAGNRIADGDRLLGTVVGAGVGGLAGAVIGSAIDGADEPDEVAYYPADEGGFDYCEAYLLNWERGYGVPGQVAYVPVMLAPAASYDRAAPRHRQVRHRVIEEDVAAPPRRMRAAPASVPAPDKRLRAD